MRTVLNRLVPVVLLVLGLAGCEGKANNNEHTIKLYQLGSQKYGHVTKAPQDYDRLEERRLARAHFLFADGRLHDAYRCAQQVFGTSCEPDAKVLCGIICTRLGDYAQAQRYLRPAAAADTDNRWPTAALIWSLTEAGDFVEAEKLSVAWSEDSTSAYAWNALAAVRQERDFAWWLTLGWRLLMCLPILIVALILLWVFCKQAEQVALARALRSRVPSVAVLPYQRRRQEDEP